MIYLQSSNLVRSNVPQALVYGGPTGSAAYGDFLVVVVASYREITSVSAGWTEVASVGSVGQWLKVLTRSYSESGNQCSLSFSAIDEGPVTAVGMCWRASNGFQTTPVKSHTENINNGSIVTSYALSSTLANVTSDTKAIFVGGDGDSVTNNFSLGVSGTSWFKELSYDGTAYGHGMIATYGGTGTTSAPSVTFGGTASAASSATLKLALTP